MYRKYPEKPRMLTTREVSRIYGIPFGTLCNWRSQSRGPKFYKVSRKRLYDVQDVEAFLKRRPVLTKDSLPEAKSEN
jgi:hypothetical protein